MIILNYSKYYLMNIIYFHLRQSYLEDNIYSCMVMIYERSLLRPAVV